MCQCFCTLRWLPPALTFLLRQNYKSHQPLLSLIPVLWQSLRSNWWVGPEEEDEIKQEKEEGKVLKPEGDLWVTFVTVLCSPSQIWAKSKPLYCQRGRKSQKNSCFWLIVSAHSVIGSVCITSYCKEHVLFALFKLNM